MPHQSDDERMSIPMVEIFGSTFVLLLILLFIFNVLNRPAGHSRLEETVEEGEYRISWDETTHGYVLLVFPQKIKIIEKNLFVPRNRICSRGAGFIEYAREKYVSARQQLIFTILEGSVATMAEARECLRRIMPGREISIGWMVANNEFLKAVKLEDIPAYMDRVLEDKP